MRWGVNALMRWGVNALMRWGVDALTAQRAQGGGDVSRTNTQSS
jgi:hypothetical protein